ncbi:hypothetical protein [Gemmatimonas sp.]|uniref:hypothetical protein n=1 Tax=Gemmatimonas sp. TaxID=1962908 RepID=UPI003983B6EF
MTRSKFLLVATLVGGAAVAVTACGDGKPAPAADSAAATAAASSTDTVKVQGVWSDSVTAESGYLAEYVNGKLVVIEEQMLLADSTTSTRAYFYNANYEPTRLFEHRALTAASSNSTPKTLHSLLNIYLTGDNVDSTSKKVDFVAKTVQPYEVANMRKHERELFARVSMTYTAPRTNR